MSETSTPELPLLPLAREACRSYDATAALRTAIHAEFESFEEG